MPALPALPVHALMRVLALVSRCWARANVATLSSFPSSPEGMFLRRLASGVAHGPRAICLLTPVGVQTLCQKPRAAGVRVFHHGRQPRPDAVRSACAALGRWRKRVSRAPRCARPGAGGRAPCRQVGTTVASRGPSGGPHALPAGAALDEAQATQLLHALQHRLRPSQGEVGLDAGSPCPDDETPYGQLTRL